MKRKIVYISGGRMDFGLMLSTLKKINNDPKLSLQVYYTGLHLMKTFGNTYKEVIKEFPKAKKIDVLYESDDKSSTSFFIGKLISKLTQEFIKNKPDITITLGDRAEMLATAITSVYNGILTAHIHGGDKTGHIDELIRHAITKLSHLHFAANQDSADRIKKMGEDNFRVFVTGAPGLDSIINEEIPSKNELMKYLKLKQKSNFLLVTQHPVFNENSKKHMRSIIEAVKQFKLPVIIIYPNADSGGKEIINIINKEKRNKLFKILPNIDRKLFLSLEKYTTAWVTNSSAGIIESPSFFTPVINIGRRQNNRLKAKNIIESNYEVVNITKAIRKAIYDKKFLHKIKLITNPWGNGNAGVRIKNILKNIPINHYLLNKQINY